MKKKIIAMLLVAVMMLSFAACTSKEKPSSGNKKYTVGICQLVSHEALDAATKGFMDALNEELPGQVKFDLQNAAGDSNTCSTIVNSFVSANVDLIMANATPALQAAATATSTIPVIGTSVTEYGVALGIKDFSGTVGTNVSGTSDLAPLKEQAEMIKEWFPDAKNVGLLYCSAEPNSQYQVDTVKKELEAMGLTCKLFAFADSNDIAAVTQSAVNSSDVIYVPTDNTVASNSGVIDNICLPAKIPVIGGDNGICSGCGVATLSIDYYDLGVATGKMAAKVLKGEEDISKLPIGYAEKVTPKYNERICKELNITVPEGYEAIS